MISVEKPNAHLAGLLKGLVGLTVLQGLVGGYLARVRTPLEPDPARGGFITNFHYWASAVLILGCIGALISLVGEGVYRTKQRLWFGTLALFMASFLGQISGNLLPWHRHDVQTAAIEGSIAARLPVLGDAVQSLVLNGSSVSPATYTRWFQAHWLMILLAIGGCLAIFRELKNDQGGKFDALAPLVLTGILSVFLAAPSGTLATSADFSAYNALPSWYTLPLHGALKAFSALSPNLGWVGAFLLPGMLTLVLVLLPRLGRSLSKSAINGLVGVPFFGLVALGLTFGGNFAPITGSQEPVATVTTKPAQTVPAIPVDAAMAERGMALFRTIGCRNCHAIDGSGSGINLTDVHKKHKDSSWYKSFIKNPTSVNNGSTMPAFSNLTEAQLSDLAEFLRKPR